MKQEMGFNESKVEHFNYDIKEKNLFKDILMYMRSQFHTEDTPVNHQDSGELLIWCYPFNEFEIFIKIWKNNYFLEFEPDGHKSKSIKYQGTSLEEFKNDLKDFIDNNNLTPYEYLSESKLQEMDFRYKAKVDKKWLKGRSLTDKKEDATEFESESEPTQIINQLKRDGKIPQKATIKIVKKRESAKVDYENIYREATIKEGLFSPKPWSAKAIEKAKKAKPDVTETPNVTEPPHKYSVHIKNLSTQQLFELIAMNNISNGVELFGFGLAKIEERFYLYLWHPTEVNWHHPKMGLNKLTRQSSEIKLKRLSEDFTDEMANDLSHWIKNKEMFGTNSGRVWPLFASAASEDSDAKYEGIIVFGDDKSTVHKYIKLYDKLTYGKNALPFESDDYTGYISEIPNKFQMGSWFSVNLDPKEIMSLGIGQRDIFDDTAKKNYGEIAINDLNESINIDYNNIYREGKIKEFGPTYYYNLVRKYNEKLCDAKNDLEEAFFEYIHNAFWYASEVKSAQYKFYLRQLITEPSSIEYYHGEDFEEDYAYDFKQFIKDPIKNENTLKEYLDKEDIPAWDNLKNLFSDDKSYERFNKKYKKEREESEAKHAEAQAKFKQETKPLDDAIKSVGLEIFYFEYFENINEFAFVINTEDEYDAENARDEVAKVLNGAADNVYGASYDDIEGMGDVHLGCVQYYEFSEMNGGDRYEDLDEDYRDKYVIFACPKQKWINYRRMTDY